MGLSLRIAVTLVVLATLVNDYAAVPMPGLLDQAPPIVAAPNVAAPNGSALAAPAAPAAPPNVAAPNGSAPAAPAAPAAASDLTKTAGSGGTGDLTAAKSGSSGSSNEGFENYNIGWLFGNGGWLFKFKLFVDECFKFFFGLRG